MMHHLVLCTKEEKWQIWAGLSGVQDSAVRFRGSVEWWNIQPDKTSVRKCALDKLWAVEWFKLIRFVKTTASVLAQQMCVVPNGGEEVAGRWLPSHRNEVQKIRMLRSLWLSNKGFPQILLHLPNSYRRNCKKRMWGFACQPFTLFSSLQLAKFQFDDLNNFHGTP